MSEHVPSCARCDDEGYVCEACLEPEPRCLYDEAMDEDDDPLPDLRRCSCNPRIANVARPLVPGEGETA